MKQKKINQIEPLISKSDINAINEYLNKKNWITENKYTKNFEQNFSEVVGSKFAVAFPNGTLTLLGILKALNLQKNSFVLVPNITMVATATAVSLAGLSPLFVDVEKESLCMCPKDLKKKNKKKCFSCYLCHIKWKVWLNR